MSNATKIILIVILGIVVLLGLAIAYRHSHKTTGLFTQSSSVLGQTTTSSSSASSNPTVASGNKNGSPVIDDKALQELDNTFNQDDSALDQDLNSLGQ